MHLEGVGGGRVSGEITNFSHPPDGSLTIGAYVVGMRKTIGRNRKSLLADIFARGISALSYSLDNGFRGVPVSMNWIRKEFDTFSFAKLTTSDNLNYMLHVTGRQWYEFQVPIRTCCDRTHYPGETCATFEPRCAAGHAKYLAHCEYCTVLQMELSGELVPIRISEFA